MWYLCMMFAMISGGIFFSLANGPPGASLIKKKLSVTIMKSVGTMLNNLRTMNLDIVSSLTKGTYRHRVAILRAAPVQPVERVAWRIV